jgi:hypothetical protein
VNFPEDISCSIDRNAVSIFLRSSNEINPALANAAACAIEPAMS